VDGRRIVEWRRSFGRRKEGDYWEIETE